MIYLYHKLKKGVTGMEEQAKYFGISGNALKLLACVSMLTDHVGMLLFPNVRLLRIIGRLAFPIFSYLIFEGCRYTKNKTRYFLQIFILGLATSAVTSIAYSRPYFTSLITFSCSIILIYLLQNFKELEDKKKKAADLLLFACALFLMFVLTRLVNVEFGLSGILLPVYPAAISLIQDGTRKKLLLLDPKFLAFATGLLIHAVTRGNLQPYALVALVPLALYNGNRGFYMPKYTFYIFYPTHIAVLWLISLLM